MFSLYDIVILKTDRPDVNLTKGLEGVIIDYVEADNVYSVEFYDENGETIEDSVLAYFTPDELLFKERPKQ